MDSQIQYVEALASTADRLLGSVQEHALRVSESPPAYLIESAEGITTYPGFGDDEASIRAKTWLDKRLLDWELHYPSLTLRSTVQGY